MINNQLIRGMILLLPLLAMVSSEVYADKKGKSHYDRESKRSLSRPAPKNYRLDKRYRHDRYYPSRGIKLKRLPTKYYEISFRNRPYFYNSGIWYRRIGAQFVVTVPPFGVVVPFLPNFYTTLWVSGVPYYYANDIYYTWQPNQNGYVVTEPPQGINEKETQLLPEQLFIYPKQGQSETKQADDKYQCHRWAFSQTGFDPSQPPDNMTQHEIGSKRDNYQKAIQSCLEGRGYSVR